MKSFSQMGQDMLVLKHYKDKTDGFFVDIGAHDGVYLSNSLALENIGWKGICVECNPMRFQQLCANRKTAICVDKAVYTQTDKEVTFDICVNHDELSGISTCIGELYRKHVDDSKKQIQVKTITLTDLLKNSSAPPLVDYLSLDTEGSELDILSSHDFSLYNFGLIHLEHNYQEPKRTNIKELLISKNYSYIGPNQQDDVYVYNK